MPNKDSQIKAHCNNCLYETNHEIVCKKEYRYDDEAIVQFTSYEILVCLGCDNVGFRSVATGSEIYGPDGIPTEEITYYPPAVSRQKPVWLNWHDLNDASEQIPPLMNEIYTALHNDSKILATIGIRTVIDTMMTKEVGDLRRFADKLNAFESKGFISAKTKAMLNRVIDAGSASAHRGYKPSIEDIHALLDVTEGLLSSIYVLPLAVDRATQKVPSKPTQRT
jgi:hypothetical protein